MTTLLLEKKSNAPKNEPTDITDMVETAKTVQNKVSAYHDLILRF